MKLRIQGDTLRLRLTRTEVARLAAGEAVEEAMHVGPGAALRYALHADPAADSLRATLDRGLLVVTLPAAWAKPWAGGDRVGFEATQDAGDGRTLVLLVEKDFACLHGPRDEPDAFPNPATRVPDADA